MKKKGSFLSGLIVFILIIIILGGVGYLGFNIIKNANGMTGMNMASDSTQDTKNTDPTGPEAPTDTAGNTPSNAKNAYKVSQINQVMLNKEALDKAYNTINSALDKMTLDPYGSDADSSNSISNQTDQSGDAQNSSQSETTSNTTVNVYSGDVTNDSIQMQSMGTTYDADKMQQLHSGLYKVSVGMQLLKQLQDDIAKQIEQSSSDTSTETEYYMNQYYKTIELQNKLNKALTYINEAADLININPYVDENGLVYDSDRMSNLHESIFTIAQGVADLNILNDNFLTQAVNLGTLAQNTYTQSQDSSTMNMTSSSLSVTSVIKVVLIVFVVVFVFGFIGAISRLFKSGEKNNEQ